MNKTNPKPYPAAEKVESKIDRMIANAKAIASVWEQRRYEIARDVLVAFAYYDYGDAEKESRKAIEYADELIRQLRSEKQVRPDDMAKEMK